MQGEKKQTKKQKPTKKTNHPKPQPYPKGLFSSA